MPSSPISPYANSYFISGHSPSGSELEPSPSLSLPSQAGRQLIAELSNSLRQETPLDRSMFGGREVSLSTMDLWLMTNPSNHLSIRQLDLLGLALAKFLPETNDKNIGNQSYDDMKGKGKFDLLDEPHRAHVVYQCDANMRLQFLSLRGEPEVRGADRPVLAEIDNLQWMTFSSSGSSRSSSSLSRRSSANLVRALQARLSRSGSPSAAAAAAAENSPSAESRHSFAADAPSSPMSDFLSNAAGSWQVDAPASPIEAMPQRLLGPADMDLLDMAWEMFEPTDMPRTTAASAPATGNKRPASRSSTDTPFPLKRHAGDRAQNPREAGKGKERAAAGPVAVDDDNGADGDDAGLSSDSDFDREFGELPGHSLGSEDPNSAGASLSVRNPAPAGSSGNPIDLGSPMPVRSMTISDDDFNNKSAACIGFIKEKQKKALATESIKIKKLSTFTISQTQAWANEPPVKDWLAVRNILNEQSGTATQWLFVSKNGQQELDTVLERRAQRKSTAMPSQAGLQNFRNVAMSLTASTAFVTMREPAFSDEQKSMWGFNLDEIDYHKIFHDPSGPQLQDDEFLKLACRDSSKSQKLMTFGEIGNSWFHLTDIAGGVGLSRKDVLDIAYAQRGYRSLQVLGDLASASRLIKDQNGPQLSMEECIGIAKKDNTGSSLKILSDLQKYRRLLDGSLNSPALTRETIVLLANSSSRSVILNVLADSAKCARLANTVNGPGLTKEDILKFLSKERGGVTLNVLANIDKYQRLLKRYPNGPGLDRQEILEIANKSNGGFVLRTLSDGSSYYYLTQDAEGPKLNEHMIKEIAMDWNAQKVLRSYLKRT